MASQYSIVHYVPDPVADERMNVGIIVFGEGRVLTKFVQRWDRARRFGGENISFLQEFAEELSERQMDLFSGAARWDEDSLQKLARQWKNSIQLSGPRASLKAPEQLLAEVSERYLRDISILRRTRRDKRAAISLGLEALSDAFFNRFKKVPHEMLRRKETLKGRLEKHSFDIVVRNGKPICAADGLSFEVRYSEDLRKEVHATLWAVEDVRKANADLPIAVIALPPREAMPLYGDARRIFTRELKADFIPVDKVQTWAKRMAKQVQEVL